MPDSLTVLLVEDDAALVDGQQSSASAGRHRSQALNLPSTRDALYPGSRV